MKLLIPLPHPHAGSRLGWKDWINLGLSILLVISPVILWLLPANFFDDGPVLCPSKRFFDLECPGCGLTRATQHFLHGEWEVALDYNPLVVVVFPLLGLVWAAQLIALIRYGRAYYQYMKDTAKKRPDCTDNERQTQKTVLSTGNQGGPNQKSTPEIREP